MPIYEYTCSKCNKVYTFQRSIKDDDPGYDCDTCNIPLNKVYYSAGVVFNGSGYYSTDNRK